MWFEAVGNGSIRQAEKKVIEELSGFKTFNPYEHNYKGISGYCILTLKIALWSLHWSFEKSHPKIPEYLPEWIFEKHGFDTIMWVACIGADSDTYGATSGPLLAAYHSQISRSFYENLEVKDEIYSLML